jgi:xylulose-5-phosphate/fructose-6-phosphate phosphoketolase
MDVIDRVAHLGHREAYLRQDMQDRLIRQWHYAREHGEDMPEIRDWLWPN